MADLASLSIHKIDECGYFERGENTPEFGNIIEILEDLDEWVHEPGMTPKQTQTFNVDEESTYLPVYVFDILKSNVGNDYLLITWNENETAEGSFASLEADEEIGQAQVRSTEIPEDVIPGYPSYFWFLPSLGYYASIRFGGRVNGNPGMKRYMKAFMERYSRFVDSVDEQDERTLDSEILGYSGYDEDEPRNLYAKFETSRHKKDGEIAYIKNNRSKIRKIVRKIGIEQTAPVKRSLLQSFFKNLGIGEFDTRRLYDANVKYELNYKPTEAELNKMIKEWRSAHGETWDDIGFSFEGESATTRWFASAQVNKELNLNLRWNDDHTVVQIDSLLNSLRQNRQEIEQLIKETN